MGMIEMEGFTKAANSPAKQLFLRLRAVSEAFLRMLWQAWIFATRLRSNELTAAQI
jgi:hypothetical protein